MASFIRDPITLNLIGGGNMALRGIKISTKDTDAVVVPESAWGSFIEDMENNGYEWTSRNDAIAAVLGKQYTHDLQGWAVVQGPIHWDFFPTADIFDGLGWSQGFASRADHYFTEGGLTINLASADTLFLLKAITGRWRDEGGRDIDDLQALLEQGTVDWEFVREEWPGQLERSRRPESLRATASDAVRILRRDGYFVDWEP